MGRNFVGYAEQENGVDVMLASGEDFRCPCLVGADGIYSRVREMKIGDALESLNVTVVLRMVPQPILCCAIASRRLLTGQRAYTRQMVSWALRRTGTLFFRHGLSHCAGIMMASAFPHKVVPQMRDERARCVLDHERCDSVIKR